MKRLITFLTIILLSESISFASMENKILVNIGNQIITTYELKNRIKTILVLNNKELNQENVNRTKSQALSFLINYKLKKEEIIKYKITANDQLVSNHLNNIASNYNTDEKGLKTIFKSNGINYELFLDGIQIEFSWQQLIFNFYQDKINVNEKEIDKELNSLNNTMDKFILEKSKILTFKDQLKEINLKLWDIEDGKRTAEKNKDFGKIFIELARNVYKFNDERAKIKLAINNILGSNIKEVKSYE